MKIVEIKDIRFNKIVVHALNREDSPRRFEIHITDLMYSLVESFYNKVFPKHEYSYDEFESIQKWVRGKGHEIGQTNILSSTFPDKQKVTRCGKATGSIDLVLLGEIYELTTTVFPLPVNHKLPIRKSHSSFIHKVMQTIYYTACEDKPYGKLKIFSELEDVGGRTVRTWKIYLNKADREMYRGLITEKARLLHKALFIDGDWKPLLKFQAIFPWMKEPEKNIVDWMLKHPKTVAKAWREYRKAHTVFIKKRNSERWMY